MIKKINISENDRRTILSMHKLIVEQSGEITIQGTVTEDTESQDPYLNVTVKLHDSQDKMVGRAKTDVDGTYKMTVNNLVPGEYTLKFNYVGVNKSETINVYTDTTTITVNTTLEVNIQDMGETIVTAKPYRAPIFNIKVLNSNGENIDGAEIEIYHKNVLINYSTFVGMGNEGVTFDATTDTVNKKTSEDGLKNVWIDSDKYPYFSSDKDDEVCGEEERIKIVVKYQNVRVEKVVETCLNNGTYNIPTEDSKTIRVRIKKLQDFEITIPSSPSSSPESLDDTQTTKVDSPNVIYLKIGFRELIKKSTDENKPAFILFSSEGDRLSDDLITRLNTNKETINKLNNNYIPVNYVARGSDTEGYILGADSIGISQIPAIVIIKGTPDTRPNNTTPRPIKGSYIEIKRVTDLTSFFTSPKNYLTIINDLLK